MSRHSFAALILSCFSVLFTRADDSRQPQVIHDIEYARAGNQPLKLDLHLPSGKTRSPLSPFP